MTDHTSQFLTKYTGYIKASIMGFKIAKYLIAYIIYCYVKYNIVHNYLYITCDFEAANVST